MASKEIIRKKYFIKRKKKYFDTKKRFFDPLINFLKKRKFDNLALYYPSSYELNILNILEVEFLKKTKFLLPIITDKYSMHFCEWKNKDVSWTPQISFFGVQFYFTKSRGKNASLLFLELL